MDLRIFEVPYIYCPGKLVASGGTAVRHQLKFACAIINASRLHAPV